MEVRVKCTYTETYLLRAKIPVKYARFRGKNTLVGYWTGRTLDYNKRAYLEVKTSNATFWVKKVAVNIIDNSNSNSEESSGFDDYKPKKDYSKLLLFASLLLLGE